MGHPLNSKRLSIYEWMLVFLALGFTLIAFVGAVLELLLIPFVYFPIIVVISSIILLFVSLPKLMAGCKSINAQLHFHKRSNIYHSLTNAIIILSILVFSVSIRLGTVVKSPTLLAIDPWKWMGIIRQIYFTGTCSSQSLYPLGMAYFFVCFWNGENEVLFLLLRFFSPVIMIPLTTVTGYLIARRTIKNNGLCIFSSILFSSAYFYVWHTKLSLPDSFAFFLVAVSFLLLTTEMVKTSLGSMLVGVILGGAWLYHPLTTLPAIGAIILNLMFVLLVNILRKFSDAQKFFSEIKHTSTILFSFLLLSSPNTWQWILHYDQYYQWSKSVYTSMVETENVYYMLQQIFNFTGYFWIVYVLVFLGCIACYEQKARIFLPMIFYLLSLLMCIFLPQVNILFGVSRVRFIEYLCLPISLLSINAIKWISKFNLSLRSPSKEIKMSMSQLLIIILLISFPIQAQYAYRGYINTVPSALNNSLQNAINFVDKTFAPSPDVHILVEQDFYLPAYGQLSPRIIYDINISDYLPAYTITVSDCDSLEQWNSNLPTLTIDLTDYVIKNSTGIGSLKLSIDAQGWFDLNYASGPWNWSNVKYLLFYYKAENKTAIDSFQIILSDEAGSKMWLKVGTGYLQENGWNLICISFDNPLQGIANLSCISMITFSFHNPKGFKFVFWLDGIVVSELPQYPEYSYQHYVKTFQELIYKQKISVFIISEKYRPKLSRFLKESNIVFDFEIFGEEIAAVWLNYV